MSEVKYGFKYLFEPTPKHVSKWLFSLRAVIALVQGAAIYEHMDWKVQLSLLLIGGAAHELGMMFAQVDKQEEDEKVG